MILRLPVDCQMSDNVVRAREVAVLTRQKLILWALDKAGGRLGLMTLVKCAFLLRKETTVGDECAFYDFVPYKYGPFSFALYHELSALARDDHLRRTATSVTLAPESRSQARGVVGALSVRVQDDVVRVMAKYGDIPWRSLVQEVYERYPWYAVRSQLAEFRPPAGLERPAVRIAVYTVGYEGKSVDGFFDSLLRAGIQAILDVRATPLSRKYGFSRRSLSQIADRLGLEYHHLPQLGIPRQQRSTLSDSESYERLFERYERCMLPNKREHVDRAISLLRRQPSALLCMEEDVRRCHRGRLAAVISRKTALPVVHL